MGIVLLILACDLASTEAPYTVTNIGFETDELTAQPYEGEVTKIRYQDRCWWEYLEDEYMEIDVERQCIYYSLNSQIHNIKIQSKSKSNCDVLISMPSPSVHKSMGKLSWSEATVTFSMSCPSTVKKNITIHSMGRIDGLRCEGKSKVLLK